MPGGLFYAQGNMAEPPEKPKCSRWRSIALFILRLPAEIFVLIFDAVISRFIVAAAVVSVAWIPLHFLIGLGRGWLEWPSFILGVMLMGLWDTCSILTVGPLFSKFRLIQERR